jgi:V-type H+-transporting ATPase subunit H
VSLVVPTLAKALFKNPDPYQHLIPLLAHSNNPEDPIPLLASTVLATLMANSRDESPPTDQALPLILSYLCSLAKNSNDAGLQDIAVMEYSSLLYCATSRQLFWKQRSETIAPLVNILRKAGGLDGAESSASLWSGSNTLRGSGFEASMGGGVGLQLLYHVLLVMWQLSFEAEEIGDEMDEYVPLPRAPEYLD